MLITALVMSAVMSTEGNSADPKFSVERFVHQSTDSNGEVSILYTGEAEWLVEQKEAAVRFKEIPRLSRLVLMHHNVTKEELEYVSSVKSITVLQFGSLPDEIEITPGALSSLGDMTSLKELEITDEHLLAEDLAFLEKLENIQTLTLDSDLVDQHIKVIYRQQSLRHLSLRGAFTDASVPMILKLPKLESLSLSSQELTSRSIVAIGQNQTITNLSVGVGHREHYDPELFLPLTQMHQLERLEFGGAWLPADAIRSISSLDHLRHLDIPIAKDGWPGLDVLKDLKKLDSLDLQGHGAISGEMLRGAAGQPSLTRILVTSIKDQAAIDILKTLPNLKELITGNRRDSEIAKYAREQLHGVEIATPP